MSISAVKGENVSKLVLPNILQLYTSHTVAGKTYHIAFSFRPMSMILQCAGAFSCKVLGARRRDLVYQTLGEVANIGAHVCKYHQASHILRETNLLINIVYKNIVGFQLQQLLTEMRERKSNIIVYPIFMWFQKLNAMKKGILEEH